MAKGRKLTEEEIGRLANAEIHAAVTYDGTDFQKNRVRAIEYYRGEMKDLENEDGLSEAVTHDVQDVIGWILPGLMRVFFSADELGQYAPERRGGRAGREAGDRLRQPHHHEGMQRLQVFWDVFHDALLHANGVVKHWWEDSEKISVHFASGLDDDQWAELVNSPEIAVICAPRGHDAGRAASRRADRAASPTSTPDAGRRAARHAARRATTGWAASRRRLHPVAPPMAGPPGMNGGGPGAGLPPGIMVPDLAGGACLPCSRPASRYARHARHARHASRHGDAEPQMETDPLGQGAADQEVSAA